MIKYVSNCRLYNAPNKTVHIGVDKGKIVDIKANLDGNESVLLDARGMIAAPGLIDTHVHGAGGGNPTDGKAASLHTMAKTLCRLGTTAFTPTSFYFTDNDNAHLEMMAQETSAPGEADPLGMHLEGPFINPVKKGGIPLNCLAEPGRERLSDVLMRTRGRLSIMTVAPELPWNEYVIQTCREFGIIASFGHSNATADEAKAGFDRGMSLVTHLNNAMRKYDKDEQAPFTAIADSNTFVQLISDGVHLDEKAIRYFYRTIGIDRIVLITDGIESCGLPDGEYRFGGKTYRSEKGLAFYSDGSGMIGTSLPLFEIMMRFKRFTDCSFAEAGKAAAENPARCLGIDKKKGFIKTGYDADLIVFDAKGTLLHVLKSGKVIL